MTEASSSNDRMFRTIALLRLIPRHPESITTGELFKKLQRQGFNIGIRSLQRDLSGKLSTEFPLLSREEGNTIYWSFRKDAPQWSFPGLEPSVALAFMLAESHLEKVLPGAILEDLAPYFKLAREQLAEKKNIPPALWAEKVRAMPNGKALLPAQIDGEIWNTVSTALMSEQRLQVTYLSRSKQQPVNLVLHPSGLVARHSQSYLLARVEGYEDVRQFALHRIQAATSLDLDAQTSPDFNIDHYINGNFNNPASGETIELIADVSPQIAWILNETPLSNQQTLTPIENSDWQRLHAKVPDDQETLWWVFGLGENVRVCEPEIWKQAIMGRAMAMDKLYR